MRRYNITYNKTRFNIIKIIIFILIISFISILPSVTAEEMEFDITPQKIHEEEYFDVSIYEKNTIKYLDDVTINFNSNIYQIEPGEDTISIKAPVVFSDQTYKITASKTGYDTIEKTITIYNKPLLVVEPEKYTVEPNERFAVLVTDEQGNPVSDATVTIQSHSVSYKTEEDGYAWLIAPENREKITVIATKEGYETEKTPMMVNLNTQTLNFDTTYLIVIFAIIILIAAIIFVNIRNRREVNKRVKDITNEKKIEKYSSSHGAILNSIDKEKTSNNEKHERRGPKIEEIRISRPKKEKEIFSVNSNKTEDKKTMPVSNHKKNNDDWFQGKDDVRYEIDRLTGKIDEEGLDKWFEGIDDIREKIDKKVKKKDKDKEEE